MTELVVEEGWLDDDPSEEGEDDLHAGSSRLQDAVVAGSDWTTETLLNQVRRGNIELNPSFQRRDAWTLERKSRFVESLILGLPVPQLVLAERREKRGSYIVIDGKQRILSLAQYAGYGESPATGFRLRGLTTRTRLNGLSYDRMLGEPAWSDDLTSFENSTIRTVVIRGWPDEDFLYLVFLRLNTGSVPLSPQELRQALHPGEFVNFVDGFSYRSQALQEALGLRRPDFRMRDVELAVRYFGFSFFLTDYAGDLKRFLDSTCLKLNQRWEYRAGEVHSRAEGLELALKTTRELFGVNAFRRYSGANRYETRFNRAIFDLMTFHLNRADVARDALAHGPQVVKAFEELSVRDNEFADATRATTKSLMATFTRLSRWTNALNRVLDTNLPALRLENGRMALEV